MPRLPPSFLRLTSRQHPLLPALLPECRTLEQALAELRWLREHAANENLSLKHLCERRGRGEPLQYILGTQPFGELDILCRRGVLIPRPETEHLATRLATRLTATLKALPHCLPERYPLRVLDLCTGTGCIPLHIYSLLSSAGIPSRFLGIDISPTAIKLAEENLKHNVKLRLLPARAGDDLDFIKGDVLDVDTLVETARKSYEGEGDEEQKGKVDVVISNPPYISPRGFNTETARSVRNFEPKLALVPPRSPEGDIFYPAVFQIAEKLGAKIVVVELGGWEQAERVQRCWEQAASDEWEGMEKWADYAGKGRGVVAWRGGWGWVRDTVYSDIQDF